MDDHSPARNPARADTLWRGLPTWLLSSAIHLALLLAAALLLSRSSGRPASPEPELREAEIVLRSRTADREVYLSESDRQPLAATSGGDEPSVTAEDLFGELVDDAPQLRLPDVSRLPGAASGRAGNPLAVDAAALLQGDPRRPRFGSTAGDEEALEYVELPQGPKKSGPAAQTRLFGITAAGHRFVYVLDRSASMGPHLRNVLQAAKRELLDSLDGLSANHQFQIVFYNHRTKLFDPPGHERFPFAVAANKRRAEEFVNQVTAVGATNHFSALLRALELAPDVVFLLSDADTEISPHQRERIRDTAGSTVIHTIEFSLGPRASETSSLEQLALAHGGRYTHIDVRSLGKRSR